MQVPSRLGSSKRAARTAKTLGLVLLGLTAPGAPSRAAADAAPAAAAPAFRALTGHIPPAVAEAQPVAALDSSRPLSLALTLPLRHQAELADLLHGLADPTDARYGQFLTPQQFADRFSPTQADYDRVAAYARSMGLTIVATHPNRTVLDVAAPSGQAERAFGLHLRVYQARRDGRYFYAPDAEPRLPAALAGMVSGVVGLDNAAQWRPHFRVQPTPLISPFLDPYALPLQTGSGPGGALSPSDIKKAYNLAGVPQTGAGQTLALFELDGYKASDITAYESYFGLPAIPLQNVLVDGYSGAAGSGAGEVTLDIELQAALAPGASKIIVYEGPNSDAGVVDTYTKIATDNLAKQISTSWGVAENWSSASVRSSENAAFQQMAAQGQSIFAASGDSGAYDDGSTLSVDDPASQPYMTGVGGTSLTTSGAGGAYLSEKTWNRGSISNGGGGGGISTVWTIPSYQSGVAGSAASKGSATMRNVPDVSLDADPYTGYAIYFGGRWNIYGGTSCAAPLWSAFTALVNQQRAANGLGTLGFANLPIYAAAQGANGAADFHDIADGSTNLFYPAVAGYDDATGWGTFNGVALLADLSGGGSAPQAPTALVNDTDGGISYTGSWGYAGGRDLGDFQDDVHYAVTNGDSLSYTFTGTGVGYITETNSDEGAVDVYLDGVLQATVSCASGVRRSQQTVWSAGGLSAGSHTLRLVKRGGSYLLLDALSIVTGGTPTAPAAPTNLKAAPGSASVTLSWTGSAGATSYNVYRGTTSGGETLLQSGLTATSDTDTGLTNGTPYFYRVTALNGAGTSAPSSEVSATPQAPTALVNDTDGGISYTGSWGYAGGRDLGDFQDDVHYAVTNGDSLSYTFTGTGVGYITETNSDEGAVDVYLDGVLQATVSCASGVRRSQQTVWSAGGLSAGSHTLRLVKRGGSYLLLDALSIVTGK